MIRRPGTIVLLLTGLNLLNFLDRWIIAAVSPDIKRELHLSDWHTGIVLNAFLVGFMITSPVFGRLGDTLPRKWLIAGGVAVWCGATAASGLMSTFVTLVASRVLVGIGEASYASLSPTILDDLTPASRKGRVFAIFFAAIPIGSALGFVLGGQLDAHYGWRNAFFIAGGPGLLLVLACMAMAEPVRAHRHEKVPLLKVLPRLAACPRYVWAVLGAIPQTAVLGCFGSWAPHYLERRFQMTTAEADGKFGVVIVVTGFVGTFLGGFWNDARKHPDRMRSSMTVCTITAFIACPFCLLSLVAPSATLFFVFNFLAQLAIWASFAPYNAVVLGSVPPELRATAMAIGIFATHALGDLPAIPLVGLLSDKLGSLPQAMLTLPILMVVGAVTWVRASNARPRSRRPPGSSSSP
jgi:MFS family permease